MAFPLTYRDAMQQLAELAHPSQPAYIRSQALTVIVRELSPNNPRHRNVLRALEPPPRPSLPQAALSPSEQTEFHLHPVPPDLADFTQNADLPPDDDDSAEEEDDPW